MNLMAELKRRNVFRVALAYGITTWVIVQVAELAADSFLAPGWVMKMLITILMLGFPVALVMAWAYEMTPDGLRRDTVADDEQAASRATGKLDRTIVLALVAALAYIAYGKFVLDPNRDVALVESLGQATETTAHEPQLSTSDLQQNGQTNSRSIAVLPFINMSDDASNEYFSDGLSEELLNLLVKIPELQVAARTSSFSFKGKDVKIPQIARELGVTYILEGSVRKTGNHVRITAQLVKADDGFHLWSETYDRTLDDIFVTQDEIAREVVTALKITLMSAVPQVRQTDPEVYSLYLQGRYFNNIKGRENLEKAEAAFEQALSIDPGYAPALVGLNITYQNQAKYRWRSEKQALELSLAVVERALSIDSAMASAWAAMAYLKRLQWDWEGAELAINKAMKLEPNNSLVIGASASLAGTFGQLEKSIAIFERQVQLNPLYLSALRALGVRYSSVGRYDDALEVFNRVQTINPDYPRIHIDIGVVYLFSGDAESALAEIEKNKKDFDFAKARILYTLGNEVAGQAVIMGLLASSANSRPISMAMVFAWRGENDLAFEWLEIAVQQHSANISFMLINRFLRNLESDPRYPVLLEKVGLLEYWKAMSKSARQARL